MPRNKKSVLHDIYNRLYRSFGPQGWWPARTRFEVIVGAILTQNTSWLNVEKAIRNLRKKRLLSLRRMLDVSERELAEAIRPAGYFNLKAKRLHGFLRNIDRTYRGSIARMKRIPPHALRDALLAMYGVGEETADSILLYALDKPIFVVDAYTRRIFSRVGLIAPDASYGEVQQLFMGHLPHQSRLFNEYHALIVKLGKDFCTKRDPRCTQCPLQRSCRKLMV